MEINVEIIIKILESNVMNKNKFLNKFAHVVYRRAFKILTGTPAGK